MSEEERLANLPNGSYQIGAGRETERAQPVFEIDSDDFCVRIYANGNVDVPTIKAGDKTRVINRIPQLLAETERQRKIGADLAKQLSVAMEERARLIRELRLVRAEMEQLKSQLQPST